MAISGDFVIVITTGGKVIPTCLVGRNVAKHATMQRTACNRVIWPRMSTVPRLRNLTLEQKVITTVLNI